MRCKLCRIGEVIMGVGYFFFLSKMIPYINMSLKAASQNLGQFFYLFIFLSLSGSGRILLPCKIPSPESIRGHLHDLFVMQHLISGISTAFSLEMQALGCQGISQFDILPVLVFNAGGDE